MGGRCGRTFVAVGLLRLRRKAGRCFIGSLPFKLLTEHFVLPTNTNIPDPGAEAVVTLLNLLRVAFGRMAAQFAKIDRAAAIAALNIIEDHVAEDAMCLTAF
jgi:hypothetical protein